MKVESPLLERLHLDTRHFLLSGRGVLVLKELFDTIDVRKMDGLDDIQFVAFLRTVSDLTEVSVRIWLEIVLQQISFIH